jgi:hypothetical protein
MHVDIFIRSYEKDFKWLAYALKSIHKNVRGYQQVIVAVPEGQGHLLSHLTAERVIEVPDLPNGYIGQQLTKMTAWMYSDADAILYWDSDTAALEPVDIAQEFLYRGKPIIYYTPWEKVGDAICWKACTEKALGAPAEFEYMRRLPLLYLRDTVGDCCAYIERTVGRSLVPYMNSIDRFSEFNALGAFAHKFQWQDYEFRNTDHHAPPPPKIQQFWSWGGITHEVLTKLSKI